MTNQVHEATNPESPARREKGEISMVTRKGMIQVAGMVAALALLAACGGVSGGDYTINAAGWTGNWPWFWPEKARYIVDRDFIENVPVAGHDRFRLDAANGEIVITGEPDATSVTVTAELIVGSNVSRQDAESCLTRLDVIVSDRSGEIFVQTLQPDYVNGRQYIVNYTITVPSDLAVELYQVNGHVTVENIENSLLVTVENGSVYGTVALPPGGEIALWTGNGDLDLRIPASTSAELSALVGFGVITWNNLDFLDFAQTERSLTGTLGNGAGLIDLDTRNGNIEVTGFGG